MWVQGEPGPRIVGAVWSWVRENFIDGAGWVLLECWGQVPELTWMDGPVWGRLWWPLENWLELCSEGSGEMFGCHPVLSFV